MKIFRLFFETHLKIHFYSANNRIILINIYVKTKPGANGIFLIYDVTRKETIDNLILWKKFIFQHTGQKPVIFVLVNKIDLLDENSTNNLDHGKKITEKLQIKNHFEISIKLNKELQTYIEKLTIIFVDKYDRNNSGL